MRASWLAQRIVEEFHENIARFDLEEGDPGDFDFYIDGSLAYAARDTGYYPHLDQLREALNAAIEAKQGDPPDSADEVGTHDTEPDA